MQILLDLLAPSTVPPVSLLPRRGKQRLTRNYHRSNGYSPIAKDIKSYYRAERYSGTHITAKTHRSMPCTGTIGGIKSLRNRAERIKAMEDRKVCRVLRDNRA